MLYSGTSRTKKTDGAKVTPAASASGVPSLFASTGMSNGPNRQSNSYLHKRGGRSTRTGRPKVNILAMVDDAIEDGATSEAKQKASDERAAVTSPIPAHKKPVLAKQSIATKAKKTVLEPLAESQLTEEKPKTINKKVNQVKEPKEERKKLVDFENADQKPGSSTVVSQVHGRPRSKPSAKAAPKLVSNSPSSATPAWKSRLTKHGKKPFDRPVPAEQKSTGETEKKKSLSEPAPKPQLKPWQTRMKAQGKKIPEQTLPFDNPNACEITLSRHQEIEAPSTVGTDEPTNICIAPNITDTKGKGHSIAELMESTKKKKIEAPVKIPIPSKTERSVTDTTRKGHSAAELTRPVKEKNKKYPVESKIKRDIVDPSFNFPSHQSVVKPHNNDDDEEENNSTCGKKLDSYENAYESVSEPFGSPFRKKLVTTDLSKADCERSNIMIDNDDVILEKTHRATGSEGRDPTISTPRVDVVLVHLRKNLEETQKQLDNVAVVSKQGLAELEKEFTNTKETKRFRFMKDIHAQEKKNEKQYEEYQKVVDQKHQEINELRSANQRLRATIEKLPKQMAEIKVSNQSLEKSNEEIDGHIGDIRKFSEKLQTDQDRLIESSEKCKNEFLPRYRHELWERQQYLDAELKMKNLYRDCTIKITKKIEKSKQIGLIEEVISMVLETEGEVNPKFDPKFLFANNNDSSSSDDSDSESSDSDSSDSDESG